MPEIDTATMQLIDAMAYISRAMDHPKWSKDQKKQMRKVLRTLMELTPEMDHIEIGPATAQIWMHPKDTR